jgi:hypothetical protein
VSIPPASPARRRAALRAPLAGAALTDLGTERGARHPGPVAQDLRAAFDLGADDRSISLLHTGGVALAAAQARERRTRTLQGEHLALRRRNDAPGERLAAVEGTLATLATRGEQRR